MLPYKKLTLTATDMNKIETNIVQQTLLQKIPNLQGIYIFGSYGTEHATQSSDIDIALLARPSIDSWQRFEVEQILASKLKRRVDLVDLTQVGLVMQKQIVTHGQRIYTLDEASCEQFEDVVWAKYLRFNELRRGIIDDIQQRGSVY